MSQSFHRTPDRRDDLLLLGETSGAKRGDGRSVGRPVALQSILNGMYGAMVAPDTPLMPKRIAGKVFEKLIRPGRFALAEASSALSAQMSETFDSALGSLSHSTGILGDLRQNFHALTRNFEWTRSPSGPFASCNFDSGHAHALLVGPGGIEERSDVRIGLLLMAPFTRFPDHIQYQARSFLALSPMEFSATQEGWKRVSVGELSYCGAGELVALRSVSKPLLCLWCNMERR